MQSNGEKKANSQNRPLKEELEHFDQLVEKNRDAYNEAMKDFRDRFAIGNDRYNAVCE